MNNDHLHLSDTERAQMKRAFVAFMDANPAPEPKRSFVQSPFFLPVLRIPSLVAAAFLIVGGTTIAAEQSLPDDFLYPLKTEVIEPVFIESTALTPESKAKAGQTLVNRRLAEAEKMVDKKRVNATSVAKLALSLNEHSDNVHDYVRQAREEGRNAEALAVGTTLENVLEAHGEILEILASDDALLSADEEDLIEAIAGSADEIEETSEDIEEQITLIVSPDSDEYVTETDERVREALEEARKELADDESSDAGLVREARALLKDSESAQATAASYLQQGQRSAAIPHLRRALQGVEQAAILLETQEDLGE